MNNVNIPTTFPIYAKVQNVKGDKGDTGDSGVKTFATLHDFPTLGDSNHMYLAINENAVYRWDEKKLKYYCVGRDYTEIEIINGGDLDNG